MKMTCLYPDTILFNAKIYTMDEGTPTAEAIAIKDGKILCVGSNAHTLSHGGEATERIDLEGKTILPGFFDSHNHLWEVGEKLAQIRLDECTSPQEMMVLVRERAKSTPPGDWIIGTGWNEGIFNDQGLPTRHDIDSATANHPVILKRFFNMDLVNSAGLELAQIDENTLDPQGGKIEHDPDGKPNGLLRASAKQLVRKLLPLPTIDEIGSYIQKGAGLLHGFGITSVIDPGLTPDEIRAYQMLHRNHSLNIRANIMPSWHGFIDGENPEELDGRASALGVSSGFGDNWLRMGGLKMAIDGGTTSRTAFMYEPFVGEIEVKNYNRLSTEDIYRFFKMAHSLRWDIGIHCIGDRAQDIAVEQFSQVCKEDPWVDARHNIIHGYFPTEKSLSLMEDNNIAVVIQPTFIYYEGELLFKDVGEKRAHWYKPVKTYLEHNIVVTSSSDVESTVSANPFPALYSLVSRKTRDGLEIGPEQKISRYDALRTYTRGGTWLTREEIIKGSLKAGMLADLVILEKDYFSVPEEEIRNLQVCMTMIGGKIVWKNGADPKKDQVPNISS